MLQIIPSTKTFECIIINQFPLLKVRFNCFMCFSVEIILELCGIYVIQRNSHISAHIIHFHLRPIIVENKISTILCISKNALFLYFSNYVFFLKYVFHLYILFVYFIYIFKSFNRTLVSLYRTYWKCVVR